jgi:hypothetical protein
LGGGGQNLAGMAAAFARSQRCDPVTGYGAPEDSWLLIDCRRWTNIVPPPRPGWSVADYNWEALRGFDTY